MLVIQLQNKQVKMTAMEVEEVNLKEVKVVQDHKRPVKMADYLLVEIQALMIIT